MKTSVHHDIPEVADRLAELGLSSVILRTAVMAGEAARSSSTPNDPPGFAGYIAWGQTIRALREQLAPLGWQRNDEGNYSTVTDEHGCVAIAVATGDENTGSVTASPKTKNPKGSATTAAIDANNQQLAFGFINAEPIAQQSSSRVTWILLIARSEDDVRCELSLPLATGDDARIDVWQKRIILDPVQLDPLPTITLDSGPEIEVEVRRRVG